MDNIKMNKKTFEVIRSGVGYKFIVENIDIILLYYTKC